MVHDDHRDSRPHPAVGCIYTLLVLFFLFFSLGGLVARIEPEELAGTIVVDVVIGLSIVAIGALNVYCLNRSPRRWTRLVGYLAIAVIWSGALISWHWFTVFMREEDARMIRQMHHERQADDYGDTHGSG
jgi:hypothetical protein